MLATWLAAEVNVLVEQNTEVKDWRQTLPMCKNSVLSILDINFNYTSSILMYKIVYFRYTSV